MSSPMKHIPSNLLSFKPQMASMLNVLRWAFIEQACHQENTMQAHTVCSHNCPGSRHTSLQGSVSNGNNDRSLKLIRPLDKDQLCHRASCHISSCGIDQMNIHLKMRDDNLRPCSHKILMPCGEICRQNHNA